MVTRSQLHLHRDRACWNSPDHRAEHERPQQLARRCNSQRMLRYPQKIAGQRVPIASTRWTSRHRDSAARRSSGRCGSRQQLSRRGAPAQSRAQSPEGRQGLTIHALRTSISRFFHPQRRAPAPHFTSGALTAGVAPFTSFSFLNMPSNVCASDGARLGRPAISPMPTEHLAK